MTAPGLWLGDIFDDCVEAKPGEDGQEGWKADSLVRCY